MKPFDDTEQVESWQPPQMEGDLSLDILDPGNPDNKRLRPPTASQMQKMEDLARKDGFDKGYQDGLQRAEAELVQMKQRFEAMLQAMAQPLEDLGEGVEDDLLKLCLSISQQMVRREIRQDPGEIIPVIKEGLSMLSAAVRNIRVLLHPEDAKLVREIFSVSDEDQYWKIVEDAAITRGGCVIKSDTSIVDATLEKRLNAAAALVLGADRETDDRETL